MYNKRTFIFFITTGCKITTACFTHTFHLTTLSIRRICALVLAAWSIVSYFTRFRNIFKLGGQIDTILFFKIRFISNLRIQLWCLALHLYPLQQERFFLEKKSYTKHVNLESFKIVTLSKNHLFITQVDILSKNLINNFWSFHFLDKSVSRTQLNPTALPPPSKKTKQNQNH